MVTRRGRLVVWPAKLLYVPFLALGLPMLLHLQVDNQRIAQGTWRVVLSVPTPSGWVAHPATFWPGLVLLLLGLAAALTYAREALPGRWTRVEHHFFTVAAWLLLLVAILASVRFTRHVAGVGELGLDWRFLAHRRTHVLDQVTTWASLAGSIACWALSWGRRAPAQAQQDRGQRHPQQAPAHP